MTDAATSAWDDSGARAAWWRSTRGQLLLVLAGVALIVGGVATVIRAELRTDHVRQTGAPVTAIVSQDLALPQTGPCRAIRVPVTFPEVDGNSHGTLWVDNCYPGLAPGNNLEVIVDRDDPSLIVPANPDAGSDLSGTANALAIMGVLAGIALVLLNARRRRSK